MTTGVVLAGGAGRRFGRPKAGVPYGGVTLVEHAVDLLRACERVVVVSRPEIPLPALTASVLHDRDGPDCPLNALATALEAVEGDVLVLACDLPAVGPVVDRLAGLDLTTQCAVAVDDLGRRQPLCARYRCEPALHAADALLAAGERRLLRLLDELTCTEVPATAGELLNLNTPMQGRPRGG